MSGLFRGRHYSVLFVMACSRLLPCMVTTQGDRVMYRVTGTSQIGDSFLFHSGVLWFLPGGNGFDAEGDEWVVWWGEIDQLFFLKGQG